MIAGGQLLGFAKITEEVLSIGKSLNSDREAHQKTRRGLAVCNGDEFRARNYSCSWAQGSTTFWVGSRVHSYDLKANKWST